MQFSPNALSVDIQLLDNYNKSWGLPCIAKPGDAGFDIRAAISEPKILTCIPDWIADHLKIDVEECSGGHYINNPFNETLQQIIPCGFKVAIPDGFQLEIRPRSGLAAKNGIIVVNSPGTIDQGYRGEICVILMNLGTFDFRIEPGDRIAQGVLMPVYTPNFNIVDTLDDTERGAGGFGHTGV